MSEAENLLNTLYDGGVLAMDTSEEHIVVDANRTIMVPESLRDIAVQFDHNIETVTFDCPRYWDGNDLSEMTIYINYKRSDNQVGSALMENVTVDDTDETIMHFDWTISGDVTKVKGNISFLICAKQVNANGEEELHWNSQLNQQLMISEGLECAETIIDRYPDIITQLLLRMGMVENAMFKAGTITMLEPGSNPTIKSTPQKNADGSVTHIVDFGIPKAKDGTSGVYVGDGDMPDDCNVQVVPSGGVLVFSDDFKLNEHGELCLSGSVGGGVDEEAVTDIVHAALEEAKENGDFDGEEGYSPTITVSKTGTTTTLTIMDIKGVKTATIKDGEQGNPGTSVTVSNVSESTADGGSNVVTFSDGKKVTIKNGSTGSPGQTPKKGTDYFTTADKAEMVSQVKAALATETWTFTLSDGSTVTKKVVLG